MPVAAKPDSKGKLIDKDAISEESIEKKELPQPTQPILAAKLVASRGDASAQWRFLDLTHGGLALFSTPQGMVALHARAAYERVRFEQLEDSLRDNNQADSQSLLMPEPLEFDGIDRSNLEGSLLKLRKLGFVLEEFGRNFYRLEGCPHWLAPDQATTYLLSLIHISEPTRPY